MQNVQRSSNVYDLMRGKFKSNRDEVEAAEVFGFLVQSPDSWQLGTEHKRLTVRARKMALMCFDSVAQKHLTCNGGPSNSIADGCQ